MPDITLTKDQETALAEILQWLKIGSQPYLVIGGYAGTGKTTLVAYLRRELATDKGWKKKKVAFCSYTGKATSVLKTKLKEAGALLPTDSCSTIHSLIYKPVLDKGGQITGWDRATTLDTDLIVIDEGSMVNALIWNDIRSFRVPILVLGDHGQLPPVEGSFNLMQQASFHLESIVRQANDNPIIRLSRHVREGGEIPFGTFGTVHKYSLADPDAWDHFENIVARPADEYLCICGTNRTRIGLNKRIRGLKDFESEEPQANDRVICLKNNHAKAIYNGMIGTVKRIKKEGEHWYDAEITFEETTRFDGRILRYQFNQAKTLRDNGDVPVPVKEKEYGDLFDFGYALTVHKAQGSEADRVIVFEERMQLYDNDMWQRWLYTAVTRARTELYIFARG